MSGFSLMKQPALPYAGVNTPPIDVELYAPSGATARLVYQLDFGIDETGTTGFEQDGASTSPWGRVTLPSADRAGGYAGIEVGAMMCVALQDVAAGQRGFFRFWGVAGATVQAASGGAGGIQAGSMLVARTDGGLDADLAAGERCIAICLQSRTADGAAKNANVFFNGLGGFNTVHTALP